MKINKKAKKLQKKVTEAMGSLLEDDYGWEVRSCDIKCEGCLKGFDYDCPNYCPRCGKKLDYKEPEYDHKALWQAFLFGLEKFKEK